MPTIELKSVKVNETLSEETHCFSATLYVNGKRVAAASNRGTGGPTDLAPFDDSAREIVKRANEACKTQLPAIEFGPDGLTLVAPGTKDAIPRDLELVVNELVNLHCLRKAFARQMKKITVMKGGEMFHYPAKVKPSDENIDRVMALPENAGAVVLQRMPEDEAFKVFVGLHGAGDELWALLGALENLKV